MMRMTVGPPNRSHCTTVTGVLPLPVDASSRVSNPGHAVNPDRLRHGQPCVAYSGNRPRDFLGESVAVFGLRRRVSDQADDHEGRPLKSGRFIPVGEDDRAAARQRPDVLETGEVGDLEGQLRELLVDRNLLANNSRCEHLAYRLVRVDLAGVLGNLYGDIAGECFGRHDH